MKTWEITPAATDSQPMRIEADWVRYEGGLFAFWTFGPVRQTLVYGVNATRIREIKLIDTASESRIRDAWDPALCAVPPCSPDSEWRCATHAATAGETMKTWTFFGYWEDDRIVVESYTEGEVDDTRVDTGAHEQGLWAASGTGTTVDEARADALSEYDQHS
jgi:hypothetical protein